MCFSKKGSNILTTGNSSNIRFFNKTGRQLYNLWNEVKDCILYTYAYDTARNPSVGMLFFPMQGNDDN